MKNEIKTLEIVKEVEILGKKIIMYGAIKNPLFMASDVAYWIEHSNSRMMLKSIDDDEKEVNNVYTLGGIQEKWFITEDGLYETCMQSRKPIAKQMKKEIKLYLKQIRLTGGYIPIEENDTDDLIMAKALKIADKTIQDKDIIIAQKDKMIAELEPQAKAYKDLMTAKGYLQLLDVAAIVDIGRTKLCEFLREKKVLTKQSIFNVPYGRFNNNGMFTVVTEENERGNISSVTMVSPKGLNYIYKLIKKNDMLDEFDTIKLQEVQVNA